MFTEALGRSVPSPHAANIRSVLLTGHHGLVGRWLARLLSRSGYSVIGFDIRDGQDVRNASALVTAAAGTDVIVHCAVLPYLSTAPDEAMFGVNVRGTENVLRAAEKAGHTRVIVFSSSQVFGLDHGENSPQSFPIRDDFPLLAARPYGASKVAAEDRCESFTAETGVATICLRPPHVWVPGQARDVRRRWLRDPAAQWTPSWNYGAFVDIRDLASAVERAITAEVGGHHRLSICAEDIAALSPTSQMTSQLLPDVPWEPGWPSPSNPWVSLIDASPAQRVLGWRPRHTWTSSSRESVFSRIRRRLRDPMPP